MFEDNPKGPRLYFEPLGADFPRAVVEGIAARLFDRPPEAIAEVTLVVNTTRMRRQIETLFTKRGPGFLPRILLLTELDHLLSASPPPPARSPLARRLQLAQLIAPVLKAHPELAPRKSVFALADSLAALMDEMQSEGVSLDQVARLDVTDQSGHWQNALALIRVAHDFVSRISDGEDAEARQRVVVEQLALEWRVTSPSGPVIVAGSTGSRGTTALFLETVARLENGAVILPGFDDHQPASVWQEMLGSDMREDHPQFRFALLMERLACAPGHLRRWHSAHVAGRDRAAVMSLALRPAPVTDAWLREGPDLPELPQALDGLTLLEATSPRQEALAIAMRMRLALDEGRSIALITPDRRLARLVSAALDRWGIVPDDSGGTPLHFSAPGRFMRHVARLLRDPLDAELLMTLLKHPLTASEAAFPRHGLFTQRLELRLRRDTIATLDAARLGEMVFRAAEAQADADDMKRWADWLCGCFAASRQTGARPLSDWLTDHLDLCARIAGPADGAGELWQRQAGQAARTALDALGAAAHHGGEMTASDYIALLETILSDEQVRDRDEPHPEVMIWGTLEARVQGADIVILGGLNDGVWPETGAVDPWLNRALRRDAGLTLPDRRIGLSAHDFQQSVTMPEVWISRALRADDAETVPSRWVNRLVNMVAGLPSRHGPEALAAMRARGRVWLDRAERLEAVSRKDPAGRAAPRPPVPARPRDFSVTEISTLIRDPFAIYARHCLGLRPLDPLVQEPDAPIRGAVIHDILHRFVAEVAQDRDRLHVDCLMAATDAILTRDVPWPTTRLVWRARMEKVAPWIVESEAMRLEKGFPAAMEEDAQGRMMLPEIAGSIRARADRIDLTPDGHAILYDYKSGKPPTDPEQLLFEKQLLIEAAMVEAGAFERLGPRVVEAASYIGLGSPPGERPAPLDKEPPEVTRQHVVQLIESYLRPGQHFLSRRMLRSNRHIGDFDHLARFGEWEDRDPPAPEDLA